MPGFDYLALDEKLENKQGHLIADDLDSAADALLRKGYTILRLKPGKTPREGHAGSVAGTMGRAFRGASVSRQDIMFLCLELSSLIKGGVPILRGLSVLGQNAANPNLRLALQQVAREISGGATLSEAMARRSDVFPRLLSALVSAGEAGGKLPEVLKKTADYLWIQEDLRKRVGGAMTYPLIMLAVAALVIVAFSVKVIPTFADIFKTFHLNLPAVTLGVLFFAGFIRSHLPGLVVGAAGTFAGVKLYVRTPEGRLALARLKRRAPLVHPLFEHEMLERFANTAAIMLDSGLTLMNALPILEEVLDDPLYSGAVRAAAAEIVRGETFGEALRRQNLFPPQLLNAVAVGEESGKLAESLSIQAEYHRIRLDFFVRQLGTLIEPVMICLVGALVGVLMFALFMPMFELTRIRPQ